MQPSYKEGGKNFGLQCQMQATSLCILFKPPTLPFIIDQSTRPCPPLVTIDTDYLPYCQPCEHVMVLMQTVLRHTYIQIYSRHCSSVTRLPPDGGAGVSNLGHIPRAAIRCKVVGTWYFGLAMCHYFKSRGIEFEFQAIISCKIMASKAASNCKALSGKYGAISSWPRMASLKTVVISSISLIIQSPTARCWETTKDQCPRT